MSTAELFPSESLNKTLVLGDSLYHTVSHLRKSRQRIEIAYSEEKYLDTPLMMSLPKLGVRLMFDAAGNQSLRLIEVLSFDFLKLLYKGHYLNDIVYHTPSDEELLIESQGDGSKHLESNKHVSPPTLKEVYNKIFGPTFPGELHVSSRSYMLSYPGVAFRFEIRSNDLFRRVSVLEDKNHILSRLTNWEPAADIPCTSLAIFQGEDYTSFITQLQQITRLKAQATAPAHSSDFAVENIEVILETGVAEIEYSSRNTRSFASLVIGKSTQQDVLRIVGPPDSYFNKFDSRLSIHKHLKPGSKNTSKDCSVYKFHNYFRYGIDFLYNLNPASGVGGVLEKIVLHNGGNVKSLDFMQWNKCNWTIRTSAALKSPSAHSEMYFSEFSPEFLEQIKSDNSEPVLLNRGDSDNADDYDLELVSSEEFRNGPCTSTSPSQQSNFISKNVKTWGQSRLYGYQRCIMEVNESNDCVSCVTIY